MIIAVGIDVCDVARFAETLERAPRLRQRLFTPAERALPVRSLAARFAAKEALAKALGAPVGLHWHDCTVHRGDDGRPHLTMTGTVAARAAEIGVTRVHVSLSHDAGVASAMVVCEGDPLEGAPS